MIIGNMCLGAGIPSKDLELGLGPLSDCTAIPPSWLSSLHIPSAAILALTLARRRLLQAELIPKALAEAGNNNSQVCNEAPDLASRQELFNNNKQEPAAPFSSLQKWHIDVVNTPVGAWVFWALPGLSRDMMLLPF